jgi:hypothetical protein
MRKYLDKWYTNNQPDIDTMQQINIKFHNLHIHENKEPAEDDMFPIDTSKDTKDSSTSIRDLRSTTNHRSGGQSPQNVSSERKIGSQQSSKSGIFYQQPINYFIAGNNYGNFAMCGLMKCKYVRRQNIGYAQVTATNPKKGPGSKIGSNDQEKASRVNSPVDYSTNKGKFHFFS